MKTTIFLVLNLFAIQVHAQTSIQSFEATIEYDKAQRPCIQVNLDPEPKTLKNAWKDYLKSNYDFKLKGIGFLRNKDLLSAEAIILKQVSSKEMDFYTHIVEDINGSEMKVFVRYGYDIYLTKELNPNEYEALTEMLDSFLKYYLPEYYETNVSDTKKRVKELTEESNDLQEKIGDNSKDIVKLNKEIEDLEEESKANNERLVVASEKLEKRSEKLEKIRAQLGKL
jgi:prefoldin subunit 5